MPDVEVRRHTDTLPETLYRRVHRCYDDSPEDQASRARQSQPEISRP
ncbi:MAG: hypothetical protein MZV65_31890 [Chromatiales bacterium]|nr:hypothetical protein [Chromatiales bacterium]